MKELWDAYLEDGRKISGMTLVRDEKIPDNIFHIVAEVLIQHKDSSYLLTKRALTKNIMPGLYEATSGGSVLKGETPFDAAKREVYEETGIKVNTLVPTYTIVSKSDNTIFYGYQTVVDIDKTDIKLQLSETIDYLWLNPDEFSSFIESDKYIESHARRIKNYIGE